jgi:hypothetical protein
MRLQDKPWRVCNFLRRRHRNRNRRRHLIRHRQLRDNQKDLLD